MTTPYPTLQDKTAIVTGGANGIGRAVAARLAEAGASVAVVDIDRQAAAAAAEDLGGNAMALKTDVSKAAEVEAMVRAVLERWGGIDILVNNAGVIGNDVPVKELTEEEWDRVLTINLKSVFLCSRGVIGHMMERRRGAIVSMASISGKEGNPNMTPYSVSKAGIICFTKALAKEVVSYGIRVNCVAPALIETRFTAEMDAQQIAYMTSKIPMGRLGRPEEVAAVVHFLVSDDASFTTGQCYDVSGGRATY
jgi:NAD(P)-dependent dehydrogenase (short-subunit alcohol dehydrogenase family)